MIIACPSCKARYKVDESRIPPGGATLRCQRCQGLFLVRPKAEPPPIPLDIPGPEGPGMSAPFPGPPSAGGGPAVIVAHDSDAVRRMIAGILTKEHLTVIEARDGVEAFMMIQKIKPRVAILDVALPKMFGFEICEAIKREEAIKGIKVILLASAYDRTRLRRRPENLYGAEGYLEKHEIQAELPPLVRSLLAPSPEGAPSMGGEAPGGPSAEPPSTPGGAPEPPSPAEAAGAPPPAEEPARDGRPEDGHTEEEERELEKARRLARIIVSDLALYNKDLVDEGVRTGQFYELLERDVKEGRELYAARAPEWIREKTNFLEEGFETLIEAKKKDLGIA